MELLFVTPSGTFSVEHKHVKKKKRLPVTYVDVSVILWDYFFLSRRKTNLLDRQHELNV